MRPYVSRIEVHYRCIKEVTSMSVTELVFILDRSGSMSGLESDTIGGFNSLLEKQKKEKGEAFITTVLFDDKLVTIHDRLPIKEVKSMTSKEYYVRGCTAMLDAIGSTIEHITNIHKYIRKEDVPSKTMFIITTDGMENASHTYSYEDLKKRIEQKKELGWEFLFLGANIDAIDTAKKFGIEQERAVNYHNDAEGVALNYECLSEAISTVRCAAPLNKEWKKAIEKDYKTRK